MSAVISENLQIQNAENFKKLLYDSGEGTANIFFTYGKTTSWANDSSPPIANTSVITAYEVWDNMIGAKKLTGNDVKAVIYRNDWSANTVYNQYTHENTNFDQNNKFYIVTSDWNVYKCLSNNSGSLSTVEPTQLSVTIPIQELDGYIWKYMYTIEDSERFRYTTDEYIPVETLKTNDNSTQWNIQYNAVPGAIETIHILNAGDGFTNANTITISISGDGTSAAANAQINTSSNTISNIIITNRGQNYTFANVIAIDTGTGANSELKAAIAPLGGHGSDPLYELGGSKVIINPRLNRTEINNKFPVENEFRQIAIISDPKLKDSANLASNVIYSQYSTVVMDNSLSSYDEDEIVYQGSLISPDFKARVLEWNSANSELKLVNMKGTITLSEQLKGANSGATTVSRYLVPNELEPYTGKLLYIDNILPITRSSDQTEDFKLLIKF